MIAAENAIILWNSEAGDGPGKPRQGWRQRAIGKMLPADQARAFLFEARRAKNRPRPGSGQEAAVRALELLDQLPTVPQRQLAGGVRCASPSRQDVTPRGSRYRHLSWRRFVINS